VNPQNYARIKMVYYPLMRLYQ